MSEAQKQPLSPKEQIREEVEAREPSYQEYIKSHGYTEMMVNDPEAQMAYKVISKSEPLQPDSYGDIRYYLMDVTLKIQDPEGVRQVIAQDIQIIFSGERKGKSGWLTYTIKAEYITNNGLRRSKIIVLKDMSTPINEKLDNWTARSNNHLSVRNLTVFRK